MKAVHFSLILICDAVCLFFAFFFNHPATGNVTIIIFKRYCIIHFFS